jgi:phenylpropionate dioxygenase-like ring-hydroxylating dioxygenase large terminal subunit
MWLRNCWYVIAWAHEIPADGFLARKVLNEPLLVYRTTRGKLAALEDRCCHRHAPLSRGRREGDCIRCGYHGIKFDASGACVEVPGLEQVPAAARVRTYPVIEHNKWVFVWMGDAARAENTMLPDNFSCDDPGWRYQPGYMHYDTPYLLICDNLLDFSHLSYVHEKTLGGSPAIAQARPVIEQVDAAGQRGLRVTRHVPNVPPPPYYHKIATLDGNIDRWFIYDFLLPGTLLMQSGGRPVSASPDDMSHAVQLHSCQTLTPETDSSTHYFFQQAHQTGKGDASVTEGIFQSLLAAFVEDREMISAQHANFDRSASARMQPLWMDSALVQFRQLLAAAVAAET